jgi:hypothetical protein
MLDWRWDYRPPGNPEAADQYLTKISGEMGGSGNVLIRDPGMWWPDL